MGKKGASKALKRSRSPPFWPISKKKFRWIVKPIPGPHPSNRCLPLLLVLRDLTGYAKNRLEAKYILSRGQVKVCGKVRKDEAFPVGLMDTIEFIPLNKSFCVVPSSTDFLALRLVRDEEKKFKLCRIESKTTVKGGQVQVNLHDGRNILINVKGSEQPAEDVYNTYDVLKLEMPSAKILGHIKFGKGVLVVIIGGANTGQLGRIVNIEGGVDLKPTMVTIERKDGSTFQSPVEYVFALGDKEPWISLPEAIQ